MKLGKNAPEAVVAHRIRWEVHSLEVASSERERSEWHLTPFPRQELFHGSENHAVSWLVKGWNLPQFLCHTGLQLTIIFIIGGSPDSFHDNCWVLQSWKYQVIVKNAHHKFPQPRLTSAYSSFCKWKTCGCYILCTALGGTGITTGTIVGPFFL